MQEDLRLAQPGKGDDRLAMRIVLSVGDVLHQDGALIGDAIVLAARIEALTPPDEIYLSPAAWHAVTQGEVRTALVDTFTLKGFTEPIPVYRIEQTHRTHVIVDQYTVMADLRGFSAFAEAASIPAVENVLDRLLELVERVCGELGGTTRFNAGDAYCLTFPEPALVMAAVQRLAQEWGTFAHDEELPCPINIAVHKGALHAYRSYLYSHDLNIVFWVEEAMKRAPPSSHAIFVTGDVRRDLVSTPWAEQLQPVDSPPADPQLAEVEIYRLR
jgi:class 3 adenylate cyclase